MHRAFWAQGSCLTTVSHASFFGVGAVVVVVTTYMPASPSGVYYLGGSVQGEHSKPCAAPALPVFLEDLAP